MLIKCENVQTRRCADVQIESAHLHIYAFAHLFSVGDRPISPILRPF